ncbi:MAG: hypothetical protein A3G81_11995 [Betaproteobacteria bacterium RIFCSPLOWO2_12_FULL_65_14]|nr:MAG: hypothetical protein A3G81_11995 [Betaproteobacteria bacterium RIFCSPLOWO2_12_FULL_65_14]
MGNKIIFSPAQRTRLMEIKEVPRDAVDDLDAASPPRTCLLLREIKMAHVSRNILPGLVTERGE